MPYQNKLQPLEDSINTPYHHTSLAAGRWFTMTLTEQLGNVGNEVSRALKARGKDEQRFENAVFRGLNGKIKLADRENKIPETKGLNGRVRFFGST